MWDTPNIRDKATGVAGTLPNVAPAGLLRAADAAAAQLESVEDAAVHGRQRAARGRAYTYLASYAAKKVALARAAARKHKAITEGELDREAQRLSPWRDCGEPIGYYEKPKPEGGTRPITTFGYRRTALQILVDDALKALGRRTAFDFARSGGGPMAVYNEVADLHAQGYIWFVTADIADCFGSLGHDGLKRVLPLPNTVVETVIGNGRQGSAHSPDTGGDTGAHRDRPGRGIPQGAVCSSEVAGIAIGRVVEKVAPCGRALLYGDDLLIPTASKSQAKVTRKALAQALAEDPVGPVGLRSAHVKDLQIKGVDFIGRRYEQASEFWGGFFRCRPSNKAFHRFMDRAARLGANAHPEPRDEKIDIYASRWGKSFPNWHKPLPADAMFVVTIQRAKEKADNLAHQGT
ncbi:hypothetical protein CKO28_18485 [Rhodovibrio sodomensis]|uniref:Reverse transcriptase domain-containing protein n=1 Tax=Rhodovibrio sodomensis TaxID=1088 RepID=A0ABS1DKZ4_9PROT|nr:reverse transcriptase domain-containing protein [Rhodovibrio sodomensis]MBK1670025.1 hypothetical protein [Rhodovibrio sodomensis]